MIPTAAGGRGGRGAGGPQTLGLTVNYRVGSGDWTPLGPRGPFTGSPASGAVTYSHRRRLAVLIRVVETYRTDGKVFDWSVDLASTGSSPVTVGDFGITIPMVGPTGAESEANLRAGVPEAPVHLGERVLLLLRPRLGRPALPARHGQARHQARVRRHGSRRRAGLRAREQGRLRGTPGHLAAAHDVTRPSRGREAREPRDLRRPDAVGGSYDDLRRLLYDEGLFDVRVVPGMTVPTDLGARFSLHTKATIESVTAEFPAQTPSRRWRPRGRRHGRHARLRGGLQETRREHADHPPRRRTADLPRVLRDRAASRRSSRSARAFSSRPSRSRTRPSGGTASMAPTT